MSGRPNFPNLPLVAPADDPNSALSNLYKFRVQNPLLATSTAMHFSEPNSPSRSASYTPGPSSPRSITPWMRPHSPTTGAPNPNFDSSRLAIPSEAYAPSYRPPRAFPSTGHMPSLAPKPTQHSKHTPGPYRQQQQLPSVTRRMIVTRIHGLLSDNLDSEFWIKTPDAFVQLSERVATLVTHQGSTGNLGPNGLSGLDDIFLCIGHEGTKHYMCLAVRSAISDVIIFVRGQSCEEDGKDPMHDETLMEKVKEGFDWEAMNAYWNIKAEKTQNGNAWKG